MPKATPIEQKLRQAALAILAETGAPQVGVSALAKAAGVARGTVYNNLATPALRYDQLARALVETLTQQMGAALEQIEDPAQKVSVLIRLMLRQAHTDPTWAKFVLRFVLVDPAMKLFWAGLPAQVIEEGREAGVFDHEGIPLPSVTSQMGGAVLMAMFYIHNGRRDWDRMAQDTVQLVLRSLGVDAAQARQAAGCALPPTDPEGAKT